MVVGKVSKKAIDTSRVLDMPLHQLFAALPVQPVAPAIHTLMGMTHDPFPPCR